jgi:glycosyltransferase involved in cell wall biosynthesis
VTTTQVSVVVPTRNRAPHAAACVESILTNDGFFELLVVDQSDDDSTRTALSRIRDPRLRHIASATRGVTSARNLGIELSRGDVVAFTDDDCRATPDWILSMTQIFESDPEAALVCGRVHVPEDIRQRGFTESFEPGVREWQGRFPPFGKDWGITANLALRRHIVAVAGDFDPMLGAGAPLKSGGEPDLLFRVLRAGFKIVNASEVVVHHFGTRAHGKESSRLMRGYGKGTGAALFKHVRLGDMAAVGVYARFLSANVQRVGLNIVFNRRPTGMGYLLSFVSGSLESFRYRVDRRSRRYLPRSRSNQATASDARVPGVTEFGRDRAPTVADVLEAVGHDDPR